MPSNSWMPNPICTISQAPSNWPVFDMSLAPRIETERLVLIQHSDAHISERYAGWLNDQQTTALSRQRFRKHTVESCRAYVESFAEGSNYLWAIEHRGTPNKHIGNIRANIDIDNSIADVAILIGDRSCWGTGVGTEAWKAVCDWLLNDGGMRKLQAGTTSVNKGMLGIMRKSGMIDDGIRKRHYEINGQEVDVIYAALFRDPHSA